MAPSTIRKAIGAVKDQTSISIAKVAGNIAPELEVLVVKATSHDEDPADEKYFREIISLTSYSRGYISACIATVSKRLRKTHDWMVALKSLMLVHRHLVDGNPCFEEEIVYATRRGMRVLNMSDFRDEAHSNSWDHAGFVRFYAMYLDEKVEFSVFEKKKRDGEDKFAERDERNRREYGEFRDDYDRETDRRSRSYGDLNDSLRKDVRKEGTPMREMRPERVLGRLHQLLRILDRVLGCRPAGMAKDSRLVLVALYQILKESFGLYVEICEALGILLDRFTEMEYVDCVKGFDAYVSAAKMIDELVGFYGWCKDVGIARSSEYPEVQRITQTSIAEQRIHKRIAKRTTTKKPMVNKAWKIIPRPLLETILNNHAQHHRVPQPLILHGPRGVGKTTLILDRFLGEWNKGPHLTGYVDFAQSIKDHHPNFDGSFPWYSWSSCELPSLSSCQTQLENCLESMAHKGIKLGTISSHQIFTTLNKWHGINTALRRILNQNASKIAISNKVSSSGLWDRAVFALSARFNASEIDGVLDFEEKGKSLSIDEASYFKEAIVALRLAKEVIKMQQKWRANAIADLNRSGRFSRSLANSCTDWPCLLLELLSQAAEIGHFQPKLVINNVEILRNAMLMDDSKVCGSMYHDSLIWRIIALGANERCLPVILVTSDSYYSYQAFMDFGFPDIFVSRETFGWTPQEAKMHMVTDYFTHAEWMVIDDVLGPNPRHLFEVYMLKQSNCYQKLMDNEASTFEDIVDAYLAYLQVTVVNPSMDKALSFLQKFAIDARSGKILEHRLHFGAPWRHPPSSKDPTICKEWAKIQLMDFVQSLVNAEFGVNYLADCSLEIMDDPAAVALVEVGLLYAQRDPSFFRPISKGIQRCLARWLVQERMQLSYQNLLQYLWQRIIRGRSYRHLMLQVGYDKY